MEQKRIKHSHLMSTILMYVSTLMGKGEGFGLVVERANMCRVTTSLGLEFHSLLSAEDIAKTLTGSQDLYDAFVKPAPIYALFLPAPPLVQPKHLLPFVLPEPSSSLRRRRCTRIIRTQCTYLAPCPPTCTVTPKSTLESRTCKKKAVGQGGRNSVCAVNGRRRNGSEGGTKKR